MLNYYKPLFDKVIQLNNKNLTLGQKKNLNSVMSMLSSELEKSIRNQEEKNVN